MTTATARAEVFTDEQLVRATALREARAVLVKTGFASGELDGPASDLVDLAEYIIRGTHPLARYESDDRPDEERCEGCASTEIATHDSERVPLCARCDEADRDEQAAEADQLDGDMPEPLAEPMDLPGVEELPEAEELPEVEEVAAGADD